MIGLIGFSATSRFVIVASALVDLHAGSRIHHCTRSTRRVHCDYRYPTAALDAAQTVAEMVIGSIVEPRIMGRGLGIL